MSDDWNRDRVVGDALSSVLEPAAFAGGREDRSWVLYWIARAKAGLTGDETPPPDPSIAQRVAAAVYQADYELARQELHPLHHYCAGGLVLVTAPDEEYPNGAWRPCDRCNPIGFANWREGTLHSRSAGAKTKIFQKGTDS